MRVFIYIVLIQLILFTLYVVIVTGKGQRRTAKHNESLAKSYSKPYRVSLILLVVWIAITILFTF